MSPSQFDSLRAKLLAEGFSPSYVERLIEELHDHACAIDEERELGHRGHVFSATSAYIRLGSDAALLDAARHYRAIDRFIGRHPAACFVAGPTLLLVALFLALLMAAAIISPRLTSTATEWGAGNMSFERIAVLFQTAAFLIAPTLAGASCALAARRGMRPWWPLASCVVLALLGAATTLHVGRPFAGPDRGMLALGISLTPDLVRLSIPLLIFSLFQLIAFSARRFTSIRPG